MRSGHLFNRDSSASSFPIWIDFTSFSCIISLITMSSTLLTGSDKSKHLCFVLVCREQVSSLSLLNMMLSMGFPFMPLIRLDVPFSISTILVVFYKFKIMFKKVKRKEHLGGLVG